MPEVSTPTIGVLALQGDVREHFAALRSVGADPVAVRRASELAAVDGLVIPGGESTTIARLAEVFDLFDPLRDAIAGGLPVYGSCAGMIMLATGVLDGRPDQRTFGGIDMVVRRNAFGRQVDSYETDVHLCGFDEPFRAVLIRAPWVEKAGDGVEVIARVEGGEADGRIVAVRQGHLLATSFHPELTGDARVHGLFREMVVNARRDLQGRSGTREEENT